MQPLASSRPAAALHHRHSYPYLVPAKHGKHIIVSSEPSTYKDSEWEVVEKNHKVLVEKNVESMEIKEIEVPADWNSEDNV